MYIVISIFVTLALIIDFSIGNLPLELFKSPLNIIILLSIVFYIYIISNNKNKYQYILRIGSLKGVISIFVLFIIFILISIFLPSTFNTHSWTFTSIILLLIVSLTILIIKQATLILNEIQHTKRWSHQHSIIVHLGILITITSLLFGSADSSTLYHQSITNIPDNICLTTKGEKETLPFYLISDNIKIIGTSSNIMDYIAEFRIIDKDSTITKHTSRPNHPAHFDGYDIYISDFKTSDFSDSKQITYIINKSPWKYVTYFGIILSIIGLLILFIRK